MRICYFGTYSMGPGYPRNRVIIKGLRKNGAEVVECHKELWKNPAEKVKVTKSLSAKLRVVCRILFIYGWLVVKFISIRNIDLIVVGYTGHFDVFLAKVLNVFRRKPLVFDAFLSFYDTIVMDRQIISQDSLKARGLWLIDKYACIISDAVLLDTNEHIEYFVREFGLPREKFIRVFVGEDDDIFSSPGVREGENAGVNVLFFGTYIPLHGIEYIIRAAEILKDNPDIKFTLIGTGPLLNKIVEMVNNMNLENLELITHWVNYNELTVHIRDADICLGIFGETEKAKRVIPCKIYDCMAMGRPIITGDSPAIREILTDGENAVFSMLADPEGLADAIIKLKEDKVLREKIGENAYKTYESYVSPGAIGKTLINKLDDLF